jgi:peptide/nickel transport system ATP-binding protein
MSVSSAISLTVPPADVEGQASLLAAESLTIGYRVNSRWFSAVDGVSFSIAPGEIVGVLGESGCGKTTMALSILRLLPEIATVSGGRWYFRGHDLLSLTEAQLQEVRGAQISIIFQDSSGLNPVMRVGTQVTEVLRAHAKCGTQEALGKARSTFDAIGLVDFDRICNAYPHQLSGGQRQRIAIAQALICRPSLVIADEPTAHVDGETAAEILACMKTMCARDHTSFIVISHDPKALAGIADRIVVMYAGQFVEQGPAREIFSQPLHPYTHALLQCSLDQPMATSSISNKKRFPFIAGSSPDPLDALPGCCFSPRCPDRMAVCDCRRPTLSAPASGRMVRCCKYEAS